MSDNSGHDPFVPGEPQLGAGSAPQMSPSAYGDGSSGTAPQNFGQQNSGQQNYLGILSLIFPFVGLSLVGVIMGHLGLSAVKKGRANNHGVALAGTIVSWVYAVLTVLFVLSVAGVVAYLSPQAAVQTSTADPRFDPYADSMYYYEPYYPSAEGWNVGDRETTCVVTSFASATVGTLQGSGL